MTTASASDATSARALLGHLLLAARGLAVRLDQAAEVQWMPAPRPRLSHDDAATGRHATGSHSDPTAYVALQTERLGVRQHVADSTLVLARTLRAVTAAEADLAHALAVWEGTSEAATKRGCA